MIKLCTATILGASQTKGGNELGQRSAAATAACDCLVVANDLELISCFHSSICVGVEVISDFVSQ
jgi:hypothetical protein